MALGTLGSTLNDELNRLANGGTYRDSNQMVDEALAAKQWANRENIIPYSTDTVGILNEIAGLGLDKRNWLDFNGVCNYIAGTTGLPAAAALRQVYPTTDLLTGVASYYVDAVDSQLGGGYLYLPGIAGNYASVPDSSALDITGDIDIRIKAALVNWASGAEQRLVSKFATGQGSYTLALLGNGTLLLTWYSDGTVAFSATSTASVPFNLSQIGWVRVTLDVDNGASGNTVTFFTSTDGINWTTLGTPVTQAFIAVIFAGTANLGIGASSAGTAVLTTGKFYQVQIRNGINGTIAFNANFETAMTSQTVTSFTESSSNAATVTINRTTYNFQLDTINNLGAAGSLLPTTLGSSTAADSNDPKFLDFTGTNYVYLPGVTGNTLQIPDSAALDITGDIDIRVRVAPDDWTPASDANLAFKSVATGDQRSWQFLLRSTGGLQYIWFTLGTAASAVTVNSTATLNLADGTAKWVRVTHDVDNGAGGNDVKFWSSDDGTTWTQLGSTITTAGVTSIYASTADVLSGNLLAMKFLRAQIFNGIDGTKVLDIDTSVITAGSATSFTAVTGQTVTINRSTSGRKTVAVTQPTWLFGTDDYMEVNNRYMSSGTYLYLPGVASNFASAPDAAPLDITGDIDLRCKMALDDWTPSAAQHIISKTGFSDAYAMIMNTNGTIQLLWVTSAGATVFANSTVAPTVADGATLWIRATLDVDNGASGNTTTFFTSTDGSTWTQLGTAVTQAGVTNIRNGGGTLKVGAYDTGALQPARGKFFRAQVLNGINGTVAFDANFETSITSLNQASFTESSANAATVTINRSGSAYRSAGITTAGYLYPGATNTFTASATDFLNFGASENLTVVTISRQFGTTNPAFAEIISKHNSADFSPGYAITLNASGVTAAFVAPDGTNKGTAFAQGYTSGNLSVYTGYRSGSTLAISLNAANPTTAVGSTNSLSNIHPLRIGRNSVGLLYHDMEFIGAAVFRTVLTPTQIRQISNYFANREVYL